MGNFPGNPIDEAKQQEIKRIIERVTVNFSKFYAISFKEVLVEELKKKRERLATEKVVEEKKKQKAKEPKPRRERKKKDKKKLIRLVLHHSQLLVPSFLSHMLQHITCDGRPDRRAVSCFR